MDVFGESYKLEAASIRDLLLSHTWWGIDKELVDDGRWQRFRDLELLELDRYSSEDTIKYTVKAFLKIFKGKKSLVDKIVEASKR